eukprot:s1900_g3.t1
MNGLLNPDDYEKGLEEAWERAKPAGSTVTVKDKLAKLSKQNAPHWVWIPRRLLLVAAAALLGLRCCFLASPDKLPKAKSGIDFNPAVAASAALPALTMLAEDAEAKYGDNRKSAVLVPLTTLVFPMVGFGSFVLYSFQEAWLTPNCVKTGTGIATCT